MKKSIPVLLLYFLCNSVSAEELKSFDFTIKRTFDKPVELSIIVRADSTILRTTIWAGAGGYDWKEIESATNRKLTDEEIHQLWGLMKIINLSNLPEKDDTTGFDGSTWTLKLLETRKTIQYWSPGYETKKRDIESFHDLGVYLWGLIDADGKLY
jgi:hypothetical protein